MYCTALFRSLVHGHVCYFPDILQHTADTAIQSLKQLHIKFVVGKYTEVLLCYDNQNKMSEASYNYCDW